MVNVGQDFGNIFLGFTALIGIGLILFFFLPGDPEIKDCDDLNDSTDCLELNQYLYRCPDLQDRFNQQNCSYMNVTHYGVVINE